MALETDLFARDATLIADTLRIACRDPLSRETRPALRFVFRIEKTLGKHPNKCEVSIYNLSREHRAALHKRDIPVSLEAGYVGSASQIFLGKLHYGQSVMNGVDWITTLQIGDGADKFKSSRVNVGIAGPAPVGNVLRAAASAMGLGAGNTEEKASGGGVLRTITEFTKGIVLSGKAEVQLDKVTKAMGLDWSIQDEQLVFLGPTETRAGKIVHLQPGTGLVGSPEQGDKGYVKARSLLQPSLLPGYGVQITSREVQGTFRIEKAVFTGDTFGTDWWVDIEAKPIQ